MWSRFSVTVTVTFTVTIIFTVIFTHKAYCFGVSTDIICIFIYIYIHTYMTLYTYIHTYICVIYIYILWWLSSAYACTLTKGSRFRFSSGKLVLETVESCFAALNYYENGSKWGRQLYCQSQNNWRLLSWFQRFPSSKLVLKTVESW